MSERTGQFDPSKTPGTFAGPPPGAPVEVVAPGSEAPTPEQVHRALMNEQPLPPFAPEKRMGVGPPQTIHAVPRELSASHQPAASNTDSPSRGVPKPVTDPGKVITGGWGPSQEALYFPLDGNELRELARGLMDTLNARIENDLRFHPAITYPRVRVTLSLKVEGYTASDSGFEIEHMTVKEKTPVAIAEMKGTAIEFTVEEGRREVAEDGSAENPPDRIRDELGLAKPRKHQIDGPGGKKSWVDVEPDSLQNIF